MFRSTSTRQIRPHNITLLVPFLASLHWYSITSYSIIEVFTMMYTSSYIKSAYREAKMVKYQVST